MPDTNGSGPQLTTRDRSTIYESHLSVPDLTVIRTALRYAAAGWPVFPCKPGSKKPDTPHGFKDATTDTAVIGSWWSARPDRNVAIATGAPGPDVLDVDVRPAGSGWAAFGRLKRVGLLGGARALVRTPSGGLHVYFAGTAQSCGRLPRHHIDFKAAGGYVLAPPSQVAGQAYELLDHRGDVAAMVDWTAARALLDPPRVTTPRQPDHDDASALIEWVANLTEGNRNSGLFWASCRAVENGHEDALEDLAAAAVRAGLAEPEVRATVASAVRRAVQ